MRQTLSRFAPDTFTMLLVATVVLASFAPPTAAFELPVKIATDVAIAFMFFLYGARLATARSGARVDLRDVSSHRPRALSRSAAMARARPAGLGHALSLSPAVDD